MQGDDLEAPGELDEQELGADPEAGADTVKSFYDVDEEVQMGEDFERGLEWGGER